MATKKQVAAIVKAARANQDAARAAGVRNPSPFGLVKLRMPRAVQTERFKLNAGEAWDAQFKSFGDDFVEIGYSQVLFRRFEIVGLAYPFDAKDFAKWLAATPSCAVGMGCLCAGHARGNPVDAPCDTREI